MSVKKFRMNYPILVAALGLCAAAFSMAAPNQSKADRFSSSDNAVAKRQVISEIGKVKASADVSAAGEKSTTAELDAEDVALLSRALDDPKPTVAEASVRKIGELKMQGFEDKLIAMFTEIDKKYPPGYRERLKAGIITAIGLCNGPKAFQFIDNLISSDNGAPIVKYILTAAKETGNPSLAASVRVFREKMEAELQQRRDEGADPILYSELLMNIRLARNVETSLADAKGGDQ